MRINRLGEVVAVVQHSDLNAVPLLVVHLACLATNVVVYAGCRHEVALVCSVDKHQAFVGFARQRTDRCNAAVAQRDAVVTIQPLVAIDANIGVGKHLLENDLGDVGLKDPLGPTAGVDRRGALAAVAERFVGLPTPCVGLLVVLPNAVVELAGQATDDRLVAGIGPAQPGRRETTKVNLRAYERHAPAEPRRLHRRNHTGRRSAIDDHLARDRVGGWRLGDGDQTATPNDARHYGPNNPCPTLTEQRTLHGDGSSTDHRCWFGVGGGLGHYEASEDERTSGKEAIKRSALKIVMVVRARRTRFVGR